MPIPGAFVPGRARLFLVYRFIGEESVDLLALLLSVLQLAACPGFYPNATSEYYKLACWLFFVTSVGGCAIAAHSMLESRHFLANHAGKHLLHMSHEKLEEVCVHSCIPCSTARLWIRTTPWCEGSRGRLTIAMGAKGAWNVENTAVHSAEKDPFLHVTLLRNRSARRAARSLRVSSTSSRALSSPSAQSSTFRECGTENRKTGFSHPGRSYSWRARCYQPASQQQQLHNDEQVVQAIHGPTLILTVTRSYWPWRPMSTRSAWS